MIHTQGVALDYFTTLVTPTVVAGAIAGGVTTAARRPRRLLLVSEIFPPTIGGSGVLLHGIYSRLSDVKVSVLTDAADRGGARDETIDRLEIHRRPMRSANWGVLGVAPLRDRLSVAIHIRVLSDRRDGVVHCARALPEGVSARLARLTGGAAYACWAHGEELATALASRELTALTRWAYAGCQAAIANSRNTATLLEGFGVPRERIHVVYPAVDTERFRADIDGRSVRARFAGPDDLLLLSVGRLQRRKGHDVAIRAVAELRHQLPQLRYAIVGEGEERSRLERLVRELDLERTVFFGGVLDDRLMPQLFAACDIFLLPNREDHRDIEGFGIVFLEAAAAGRPAIGGRSGGVPEAIQDGVTGLTVEATEVAAVADAIRVLASSPEIRARMGAAGRARVRSDFTWDRAAAAVSRLL